jgi:hypothetical protein
MLSISVLLNIVTVAAAWTLQFNLCSVQYNVTLMNLVSVRFEVSHDSEDFCCLGYDTM